jgi:hypothetical protein
LAQDVSKIRIPIAAMMMALITIINKEKIVPKRENFRAVSLRKSFYVS